MKNPKIVRILVAGMTATGKSTLIQLIQEALNKVGIESMQLTNEKEGLFPSAPVDSVFQRRRIKAIKDKVLVQLEERRMYENLLTGEEPFIVGIREFKPICMSQLMPVKRKRAQPRRKK